MLFNEQSFIFIFLPVVFVGLILLRCISLKFSVWWVILSSLFFYGFHAWEHVALLAGSIAFNYGFGLAIEKSANPRKRHYLLLFGVLLNLALLAVFKYADFLLGVLSAGQTLGLALPLAISFFTFQQIAYLVDIRKGKVSSPGFLHYSFFVSFFPQLIAGPIVRCQHILPQLKKGALGKLSSEWIWTGLCLFSIGLFKKACLADGIRPLAESIFTASTEGVVLSLAEAWVGATAFGLQIYFDFSAYSEMALGLGLLFGLRLPLNFNSPYKAVSMIDFWRRWHITLSEFLRDYLYKPLGGNRLGVARAITNVMLVMVLGGLWHGAGWTFVVWGAFHGILIGANHLFRAWRKSDGKSESSLVRTLPFRVATFATITLAWVFFRSEEFAPAFEMIESMLGFNGLDLPRVLGAVSQSDYFTFGGLFPNQVAQLGLLPFLAILLLLVWLSPNALNLLKVDSDLNSKIELPSGKLIFLCGLLFFWGVKVSFESITYDFIYFRF